MIHFEIINLIFLLDSFVKIMGAVIYNAKYPDWYIPNEWIGRTRDIRLQYWRTINQML